MGKIPTEKLQPTAPFRLGSVDLMGHLWVKATKNSKSSTKLWVLLYVCDVSRALHTEVVESCTGQAMVNALRSIFAIRNTPERITADPGKNFVNASKLLKEFPGGLASEDLWMIQEHWPSIKWVVNPTEAPWRNGAVEALVKQVKSSLSG